MAKEELCSLLSGRTWGSIRWRGNVLGIDRPVEARQRYSSPGPYTEEEDQLISDFHAFRITCQQLLERLSHRSEDSIWLRMFKLGFRRRKRFVRWMLVDGGNSSSEGERGESRTQEVVTSESCLRAAAASLPMSAHQIRAIRPRTVPRDALARSHPDEECARRHPGPRARWYGAAHGMGVDGLAENRRAISLTE